MTPDQYLATLSELGITQARFSRLLDVDVNTSWRWGKGLRPVPRYVELLLFTLTSGWVTVDELEAVGVPAS